MRKKTTLTLFITFAAILLLTNISALNAKEIAENTETLLDENETIPDMGPNETAQCFSRYRFQSVIIEAQTDRTNYDQGETIIINGTLQNTNEYPLVAGKLRLRLVKNQEKANSAGPDIIEEIIALRDVALRARETKTFSISYALPAVMTEGNYELHFYFDVSDKFNMSGLPFTDDIYGGFAKFTVFGEPKGINFDRSGVIVNGKPFNLVGFSKVFDEARIVINAPLRNETNAQRTIRIMENLYSWSAQNENDLLRSKSESVVIPKGGTATIVYVIEPPPDAPVYYLTLNGEDDQGRKTALFIRIVRHGFRPRINFAGISEFPFEITTQNRASNNAAIFACVHNTTSDIGEGTISVALKDENGKVIAQEERSGKIGGGMIFVERPFTPTSQNSVVFLSAKVSGVNGGVFDEILLTFDCKKDPSLCEGRKIAGGLKEQRASRAVIMLVIAVLTTFFAFYISKKMSKQNKNI